VLWEKKALDVGGRGVETVAVDDAIIHTSDGKWIFVQVKENCPAGGWTLKEFGRTGVAQQLWNQWFSRPASERSKTIVRLATGGDCQRLRVLVDVASRARTPSELLSDEATQETTKDIRTLASVLHLQTNSSDFLSFLKSLQIEPLPSAVDLESRVIERLTAFGGNAKDLKLRLIRMVARSKHLGPTAGSAHTRESLVQALLADGVTEEVLMIGGLVKIAKLHDFDFWKKYRKQIVKSFTSLRVYGLEIDRAIFADLLALFVPLRLAPLIPGKSSKQNETPKEASRRSIEEMILQEEKQAEEKQEKEKEKEPEGVVDVANAFVQKRRIALVGGPGAGKTTMLKWWAIITASEGAEGQELRRKFGLPSEPLIPLYVRFRDFARWVQANGMDGMEGRLGLVANFLAATFQRDFGQKCPTRSDALQIADELLSSEKTIFLFDGLDEVPDESMRRRLFDAVADLLKTFKEPCVIVSSRPYAFSQDRLPLELTLYEPLPLDRQGRRVFATQWYRAIKPHLGASMNDDDALLRAADLARTAERLADLAENPLLFSILALIHFNRNGLPVERAKLYDHATLAMLGHWDRSSSGRDLGEDAIPMDWAKTLQLREDQIRRSVQHLAYQVQFGEGGSEFSKTVAVDSLREGFVASSPSGNPQERAELLLRLLVERSGLVQERSPDILAFTHLSFQEYLAAGRLLEMDDSGIVAISESATDDKHAEVIRFAVAALALDTGAKSEEKIRILIDRIGGKHPTLAAACLLEVPSLKLESGAAERLARRVYYECSGRGRYVHRPRLLSRLIWTLLRFVENSDRLVLEFLASGEEGHRGPMEFEGPMAILVGRPVKPLSPELGWVLERIPRIKPRHHESLDEIARLILAEVGTSKPETHLPALVRLLGEGRGSGLNYHFGGAIGDRVDRLLLKLLKDPQTEEATRLALLAALSEAEQGYGQSRIAWEALQFLRSAEFPFCPEFANALIRHGLWLDETRPKALQQIREYLANPMTNGDMASALKSGLTDSKAETDHDARKKADLCLQCARIIQQAGLVLAPAEQKVANELQLRGFFTTLESRHNERDKTIEDDDWQIRGSSICGLLADEITQAQTVEVLAERLWSKDRNAVWFAAKLLMEAGFCHVHGVLDALINIGLSSEECRSIASQFLKELRIRPLLSHATRAALIGGLHGRTDRVAQELRRKENGIQSQEAFKNEDDAVATACAILLIETGDIETERLLGEIVPAALRHSGQALLATDHLLKMIASERRSKILGMIGKFFEDESMNAGVALVVAKAFADLGCIDVPNLSRGLVLGGLSQHANHAAILEHLIRMLEDPRFVTSTRKALAEGLESKDNDVAWGAVRCLCENTERTDPELAATIVRVGLTSSSRRDEARRWLLDLLNNPFTSQNALEQVDKGNRTAELAWEIASCLIEARKFEAELLSDFIIQGGLSSRDRHATVIVAVVPLLKEKNAFADKLEEKLWKTLIPPEKEVTHGNDVSWGAARLLIEAGKVAPEPTIPETGGESEVNSKQVDQMTTLLRVVGREVDREPFASDFFKQVGQKSKPRTPTRLALLKLLDDEKPDASFEAARCLIELGDFEHLSLPVAIARRGLAVEATRDSALRMLDKLRTFPWMAQAIRSALILASSGKDEQAAWSAAAYLMDHGDGNNPVVPRGLIFGRRRWGDGGWETVQRLQRLTENPITRGATIDALFAGLYEDRHSHRFELITLLVCAGAPLYDKVLSRMVDASRWGMAAAPLALLALSGRAKEASEVAQRIGFREVVELVGEC
jgi:hypothetical protein